MAIKLPKQIAIIDSSIKGSNCIAAEFCRKDIAIIFVDDTKHCLTALSKALNAHSPANAIHIVSHGSPGALHLGSHTLNSQSLVVYPDLIRSLKRNLTDQGDILLYGCHIAQGAIGQSFVDTFAHVTHANVAASHSLTAARSLGGNAELEYHSGLVTLPTLLDNNLLETTGTTLAAPVINSSPFALNHDTTLFGETSYSYRGMQLDILKDINGDGYDEILAGSSFWAADGTTDTRFTGKVEVVSGQDYSVLKTFEGSQTGDRIGTTVRVVGDLDNDGIEDFAYGENGTGLKGRVTVISGASLTPLYSVDGTSAYEEANAIAHGVGDLNNDGINDLLITANNYAVSSTDYRAGKIYARSGVDGSLLYTLEGSIKLNNLGKTTAFIGDINNDGYDDFAASKTEPDYTTNVLIYSGQDGALLHTLNGEHAWDRFGQSISSAGDINHDGHNDFIVTAPTHSSPSDSLTGRVYLYSGKDFSLLNTLDGQPNERLGSYVLGHTDINDDGIDDFAISSDGDNTRGALYIISGQDFSTLQLFRGSTYQGYMGSSGSLRGDINNDGYIDLITGENLTAAGLENTRAIQVYLSGPVQVSYTESGPPGLLHPQVLSINDIDSVGFNGGQLRVEITQNTNPAKDTLSIESQGNNTGQISLSSNQVSYEGVVIGNSSGGSNGIPLMIDFNSQASPAAIAALIQTLSFQSAREDFDDNSVSIKIILTDSRDESSEPLLIDIIPEGLNDAPIILPGLTHQLDTISENIPTTHNQGTRLADILDFNALSDPDGTLPQSIAVISVDNSFGFWEFSHNNGQSWTPFHDISGHWSTATRAWVLSLDNDLDKTALIRFIPDRGFSGTASLTFRANDQTDPLTSTRVDLSDPAMIGENSPFSLETGAITVTVTSINDAPRIQSDPFTATLNSVFTGPADERAGTALTSVGDLNNDGTRDFLLSSTHASTAKNYYGKVTALSGTDFSPIPLLPLQGTHVREYYGTALTGMGDLDGDGYADFALSATGADSAGIRDSGRIDIISGKTGTLIRSHLGDSADQKLGQQLVNIGDIDDDGINDLVTSPGIRTPGGLNQIELRYYSGADGSLIQTFLHAVPAFTSRSSLINATDVNNDGYDDLLLGIPQSSGHDGASAALLISGKNGTVLVEIPSTGATSQMQRSINLAGDYNHDGTMDFMVSNRDGSSAWVTIHSGVDGSPLLHIEGPPSQDFGQILSKTSDINADGFDDYLIGATTSRVKEDYKRVGIYSGKDGTLMTYIDSPSTTTFLNHTLTSAGDFNHDGLEDFLLSDGQGEVKLYSHNIPSQATTENSPAIQVHPESVTITDDDSHFGGGRLQLSITDAQHASLSQLAVLDQGPITVNGNTVSHNGIVVGTLSGGTTGTPLQIALNTQATPTVTEALIQALSFAITSDAPTEGIYTLLIELTDPAGATSQALPVRISVSADNDAPQLQHFSGDAVSYTVGGPATALDTDIAALLSDPDSTDFEGGVLTVSLTNNSNATDDTIQLLDQTDIQRVGSEVRHAGISLGTLAGGASGVPLTITLNSNATPTSVQAVIHALHYHNTDPVSVDTAQRTVTVTLSDGDGATSTAAQLTIELARLPILDLDSASAGSGYSTHFTEAAAPVAVAATGAITASDDGSFSQLQITLSSHPDGIAEQLSSSLGSGSQTINGEAITITPYDPATGILLITSDTGTASAVTMEQLIATIHYQNTALNPDTQSRSISFIATDNDSRVNIAVVTHLSIDDNNTEPTLSATALNPLVTAQQDSQPLFENVSIDTIEPGQTLSGVTLEVGQLQDPGDEYLKIDNQLFDLSTSSGPVITTQHGYSVQVTATANQALISISTDFSNSSPAEMQTLLETLHYQHSGNSPTTTAARTISLSTLTDSGGGSDTNNALAISSAITVTAHQHQHQQPDSVDSSDNWQDGVQITYPENSDNSLYELVLDTVPEGRTEDQASLNPDHADIPIIKSTEDISALINVALPAGIGIHTLSNNNPGSERYLLPFVETLLENKEQPDKADIIHGVQDFLQSHDSETLQVGQITLTSTSTVPGDLPIIIQGPRDQEDGHRNTVALTIDASQLPANSTLQLDNIDFAVVIGPAILNGGLGENIIYTGSGSQNIRLGPENDKLYGGDDDDIIGSDGGDDQIYGNGGNDVLFGGDGADQLHGGPGFDSVRYDEPLSHYTVNQHPGHINIQHQANLDVMDTLVNIEQIQFSDQTLTVTHSQNQAILATLYTKALQRQPEPDGFNWWANAIDHGQLSAGEMALSFLRSPEYQQQNGIQLEQLNIEQQIDTLYQGLLGREADTDGKAYWVDAAEKGLSLTRIADCFMHSEELSGQYLNADQWNFLT